MTGSEHGVSSRAGRLVDLVLKAYPGSFRRRFGEGIRYGWLADYREARKRGGLRPALFWLRTILSAVVNGAVERARSLRASVPAGAEAGAARSIVGRREGMGMVMGMEHLTRELAFAARRLTRRPGFSVASAGTLALGVGVTTAIFSVVDGVLLRPLPYPEPERVVLLGHRAAGRSLGMPDGAYLYFAEHASSLEQLAAYTESSATMAGTGEPLELGIIQATPSLFPTLGVTPAMGRAFTGDDAAPGADRVAVVSWAFWDRQLGSDPEVIGKPLLEGSSITVIGVLPRGFDFPRPEATFVFGNRFQSPDVYLPRRLDPSVARYGNFMYQSVGRLAPGVTPEEARRELARLMPRAAETYTGTVDRSGFTPDELREGGYQPVVETAKDAMVGHLARVLWILMGAVTVVLVIATANVANLVLVRTEGRRGELAVQRALGASRGALARSFLSESALLALVGGGTGAFLAWAATRGLPRLAPADVPRLDEVALDLQALGFAATVTLLAGVALGVAPFLRAPRTDVAEELASGKRGGTASRRRRGRDTLVVVQVALTVVLLTGSGLLLLTFRNLHGVDPGFTAENVLTLRLSLGENLVRGAGYDDGPDDAVRSRFMVDLVRRLEGIPGVVGAAYTGDLPLDGDERVDYVAVEGALPSDYDPALRTLRVFIGPGYLETVGAELLAGRELLAREFSDQPRSAVVNRAFAEARWPGRDPVGRRLLQFWAGVDPDADVWYTVVGVVENIREKSLMAPAEPTVYLPTIFLPEGGFGMPISSFVAVLRTSEPPMAIAPRARTAVHEFHPEIPVTDVATLEQLIARSFQDVTFAALLLVIAGVVSVALGLVGVYGTVAYVVGRRTREFGLRIALGASVGTVRLGVLKGAARVGAVGIALGLVGALATGRVLESLLFGVSSRDPVVGLSVAALLFGLVLAASLAPASTAASVDPVEAMRAE